MTEPLYRIFTDWYSSRTFLTLETYSLECAIRYVKAADFGIVYDIQWNTIYPKLDKPINKD